MKALPILALAALLLAVAIPQRKCDCGAKELKAQLDKIERFAVARDKAVYDWVKANDMEIAVRKINERHGLDLPVLPPVEPWAMENR